MKNAKPFIAGFVSALLVVSLVGTAFASSNFVKRELYYNNISVTLDGKRLDLQGDREPFIISGTTFLPVRAISEALGLDVEWEGATSTVILTSGQAAKEEVAAPAQPAESSAQSKAGGSVSSFSVPSIESLLKDISPSISSPSVNSDALYQQEYDSINNFYNSQIKSLAQERDRAVANIKGDYAAMTGGMESSAAKAAGDSLAQSYNSRIKALQNERDNKISELNARYGK